MNDTSDLIPENETTWQNDWQIPYFDNLTEEQQTDITDSIRLLLRQTFVLEYRERICLEKNFQNWPLFIFWH